MTFQGRMRRAILVIGAAALVATAVAGGALAASSSKTYTGCLTVSGGTLVLIKEGLSPQKPCPSGTVQVRFGEGDITSVTAGTGLSGGGESGDVSLSIATGFRLPQGCAAGRIPKWDGDSWECADDANTTYTAGTGIDIVGGEVSIDEDYRVFNDRTCATGTFVKEIDDGGTIICGTPPAPSLPHVYFSSDDYFDLGGTETVLTLTVPAGTYLVQAAFTFSNGDTDSSSAATCTIPGVQRARQLNERENLTVSLVSSSSGGTIALVCTENTADVDILDATLVATPISGAN